MRTSPSSPTAILRRCVLVLPLAAACALTVSSCHARTTSPPGTTNPATVRAPSSATPRLARTPARTYTRIRESCDLLDPGLLTTVLGDDTGPLLQLPARHTPVMDIAYCDRQYGAPAARSLTRLQIVVTDGSARSLYGAMRTADASDTTLTELPALYADGAYTWTTPRTGAHLAMLDGNLYLRISIIQGGHRIFPAAAITDLMTAIASNAMSVLAM